MNDIDGGQIDDEMRNILIPNPDLNNVMIESIPLCSVYWIASIITWVLFLLSGCFAIIQMIIISKHYNGNIGFICSFIKYKDVYNDLKSIPIQIHINIIYALFIITLIFATSQFIYFLIKSICKRDYNIYEAMMGKTTKYHFIPLLPFICFFGIGISNNYKISNKNFKYESDLISTTSIYGLILSIFILFKVFIIYNKMEIKNETFSKILLIKKGTFSCLISLCIYTLFNNFFSCIFLKNKNNIYNEGFIGFFCVLFHLIIGFLNLLLSIKLKDIIFSIMNFFIYIGMILEFFSFWNTFYPGLKWYEMADTKMKVHIFIDIVMIILSIVSLILVIFKIRTYYGII